MFGFFVIRERNGPSSKQDQVRRADPQKLPKPHRIAARVNDDLHFTKTKTPIPYQKISSTKLKILPSPPPQKIKVIEKKPDGVKAVAFQVYNGMAIAQGDILLGKVEEDVETGFAEPLPSTRWSNSRLYYGIDERVTHPERVLQALSYLSELTVLRFFPIQRGVSDALIFQPTEEHCLSYVGKISGFQPIFISGDCDWQSIVHEVLHALGFIHEHSRSDRDNYVQIMWNNIPQKFHSQFEILPDKWMQPWVQYPYDLSSIMHYPSQILSSEFPQPSLLDRKGQLIPEAQGLSELDIQKVNALFP